MPNYPDITGERIGKLTAIRRVPGSPVWMWRCECGNERLWTKMQADCRLHEYEEGRRETPPACQRCNHFVRRGVHAQGRAERGRIPTNYRNMMGEKIGRLTAVKRLGVGHNRSALWLWQCECGHAREWSTGEIMIEFRKYQRGERLSPPACKRCSRAVRGRQTQKFDDETVREARRLVRLGVRPAEVARQFGMSTVWVTMLARGKKRTDVVGR